MLATLTRIILKCPIRDPTSRSEILTNHSTDSRKFLANQIREAGYARMQVGNNTSVLKEASSDITEDHYPGFAAF